MAINLKTLRSSKDAPTHWLAANSHQIYARYLSFRNSAFGMPSENDMMVQVSLGSESRGDHNKTLGNKSEFLKRKMHHQSEHLTDFACPTTYCPTSVLSTQISDPVAAVECLLHYLVHRFIYFSLWLLWWFVHHSSHDRVANSLMLCHFQVAVSLARFYPGPNTALLSSQKSF